MTVNAGMEESWSRKQCVGFPPFALTTLLLTTQTPGGKERATEYVVVGGGGGSSKTGVPNQLVFYALDQTGLLRRETDLDTGCDTVVGVTSATTSSSSSQLAAALGDACKLFHCSLDNDSKLRQVWYLSFLTNLQNGNVG